MNAKQTRTLKLVSEPATPSETNLCHTCDAKRQLEHVKMMLQAALLAASEPPKPPPRGKR